MLKAYNDHESNNVIFSSEEENGSVQPNQLSINESISSYTGKLINLYYIILSMLIIIV